MKNCMILGSGRSGTSMATGALAQAGYFMGNQLIPMRNGNPKGFFEDAEVNKINEEILAEILPRRPRFLGRWLYLDRPLFGQRWLARVPLNCKIQAEADIRERIKSFLQHQPFCIKDPRLSYTLPAWKPYLENTVFICVFRDPVSTVKSILKEVRFEPHLHHFKISSQQALEIWLLMYEHILYCHSLEGDWLFIHYDQLLSKDGLQRMAEFAEASADFSFPDRDLHRSKSSEPIPKVAENIYEKLCTLANYEVEGDQAKICR